MWSNAIDTLAAIVAAVVAVDAEAKLVSNTIVEGAWLI